MGSTLLKVYHSLPPSGRNLAASLHGRRLRKWRYGPETDNLAQAARQRETWSAGQWSAWQAERLALVLRRAAKQVPFYRELWQKRKPASDGLETDFSFQPSSLDSQRPHRAETDWENLLNWPVLTKEEVRRSPDGFLAEGTALNRLRVEHTSGTTGTPLQLWQSQETVQSWYALMEARWRGWYGLSRDDRWAILGGQSVTPVHQKSPPFWVWNSGLQQLYLSCSHLSAATCPAYLQALQEYRVTYLWGYASALHSLAQFAAELGLKPPGLSVVISNAEPLYAHERELISRVFACPVRDTYGLSEMLCAASECEAGRLHLWPEVGIYEVLRDDEDHPVEPGETGRLVCTGLLNRDMPLIRYEVGDRIALAPLGTKCPCGRTLPILLSVEGRSDDVIKTPDGRRIGRMDPVFKGNIPMREGQIIQESPETIRVLVVPAPEFTAKHEQDLIVAVRERVGNLQVRIERVSAIPRTANGKFRAVISKVGQTVDVAEKRTKNGVVVPSSATSEHHPALPE
jgi:phenylacetate-coenzyme A ligase PaaK-like adenylate-forming protein